MMTELKVAQDFISGETILTGNLRPWLMGAHKRSCERWLDWYKIFESWEIPESVALAFNKKLEDLKETIKLYEENFI